MHYLGAKVLIEKRNLFAYIMKREDWSFCFEGIVMAKTETKIKIKPNGWFKKVLWLSKESDYYKISIISKGE